jgi:hypothetical protein
VAIKRVNMIRSECERVYYRFLSVLRRIIEMRFSQLDEFGVRYEGGFEEGFSC